MPVFALLQSSFLRYRPRWRQLIGAAVAHRLLTFILLTPVVSAVFRVFVAWFSSDIVADEDLILFFLSPAGAACLLVVGSLTVGIRVLELGASVAILASPTGEPMTAIGGIRFALRRSLVLLSFGWRIVAAGCAVAVPILLIAYGVYSSLLTKFDINYYLSQRPPEFIAAIAMAVPLVAIGIGLPCYLLSRWLFAPPIMLLEGSTAADAMRQSASRSMGVRRTILAGLLAWLGVTAFASSLASLLVFFVTQAALPLAGNSIWLIAAVSGVGVIVWTALSAVIELVAATGLFTIVFQLYVEQSSDPAAACDLSESSESIDITVGQKRWDVPLTWPRTAALLVIGLLISTGIGAGSLVTVEQPDRVEIMAHRGASLEAPENTLAAIERAIELKAGWVEIDVQLTADDKVVVTHDKDLMRLAKVDLKVSESTLAELQEADVGAGFDAKFKGERVPTLGDVLRVCRDRAGVNIELKPDPSRPGLEAAVLREVKAAGMLSQVVVMSLNATAVAESKRLEPELEVGMLLSVSATRPAEIEADFLAVNASFANRGLIQAAHNSGKRVFVWTVNDAATISLMVSRGVDAIITDDPALARRVLAERAGMSPAERLLASLAIQMGMTPKVSAQ